MPIDMELTVYDEQNPHESWKIGESADCPGCVELLRREHYAGGDRENMHGYQFWTEAQARDVAEAILRVCDDIKRKREAGDR